MNRLDNLLAYFGGWQETDGPARGIYSNQIPGHRCAWSCNWEGAHERFTSHDLRNLETMSTQELLAELLDLAHREHKSLVRMEPFSRNNGVAYLLAQFVEGLPVKREEDWKREARTCLTMARQKYPTFCLPDIFEAKVLSSPSFRPGWKSDQKPPQPPKPAVDEVLVNLGMEG
jgi:hypothetical protein